jgi:hypothetical protein
MKQQKARDRTMRYLVLLLWIALYNINSNDDVSHPFAVLALTPPNPSRRMVLEGMAIVVALPPQISFAAENVKDLSNLRSQILQARKQLDAIPKLIESEKWDSVRAILIEPPLADCWAKTNRPLLGNYAEALEGAGGDEFAALEAREEVVSHLRYLDMSVYNNNFNPIKSEGTSGATKELIRSYYEDPLIEFKASVAGVDELINLSKDL